MLRFNAAVTAADCNDPRGVEHVQSRIGRIVSLLGASDVASACRVIDDFLTRIGTPTSLAQAGITQPGELEAIARSVNEERLANNPRRANAEDLRLVLNDGQKQDDA